jgi:hypothetical protein
MLSLTQEESNIVKSYPIEYKDCIDETEARITFLQNHFPLEVIRIYNLKFFIEKKNQDIIPHIIEDFYSIPFTISSYLNLLKNYKKIFVYKIIHNPKLNFDYCFFYLM